jgi:Na+/phosphate symporter
MANHHKPLSEMQLTELKTINDKLTILLHGIARTVAPDDNTIAETPEVLKIPVEAEIEKSSKNEVKRIREEMTGNRSSILFMSMLQETRNIVHFSSQVLHSLNK